MILSKAIRYVFTGELADRGRRVSRASMSWIGFEMTTSSACYAEASARAPCPSVITEPEAIPCRAASPIRPAWGLNGATPLGSPIDPEGR